MGKSNPKVVNIESGNSVDWLGEHLKGGVSARENVSSPTVQLGHSQDSVAEETLDIISISFVDLKAKLEKVRKIAGKSRAQVAFEIAREAVAKLCPKQQSALFEEFVTHGEGFQPPLPESDPTGNTYDLFKLGDDPYQHLEKVWGGWLKHFSPELPRDYLYQDQLRRRDSLLFDTLYAKRKGIKRDYRIEFNELLKPKSARIDAELAELSDGELRNMRRIMRQLDRRPL